MQTFIIWIASVICLMIHIPQVYGATGSLRPMGKRRTPGPDPDPLPVKKQTTVVEGSQCTADEKIKSFVSEGVATHMQRCRMALTNTSRFAFTTTTDTDLLSGHKTVRLSRVSVFTCDNNQYLIKNGGLKRVKMGKEFKNVDLEDPLAAFHAATRDMTCMDTFYTLQKNILSLPSGREFLPKDMCNTIKMHVCNTYEQAVV
ncbi:hypothetical protein FOZ60_017379 [Perkinsus olseni]|uniref:Salivary lipocalin n=1 Tax=Perkinsus olseni TaxID=32597 RepID=A0A7J6P2U8_PEROL|nr:hypothetical protein FOZ60_017379 [Perkinsus olseni]